MSLYVRTTCALTIAAALFAVGCGSDGAGAKANSSAGPTSDEMSAAQAATQAANDGSEGASASGANTSSTARAEKAVEASSGGAVAISAATGAAVPVARARCLTSALKQGAADAQEILTLLPSISASTNLAANTALSSTGVGKGNIFLSAQLYGSSSKSASVNGFVSVTNTAGASGELPLLFQDGSCKVGARSLTGKELVQYNVSSDGSGLSVQVGADLTWKTATASWHVTSADPNMPTYQLVRDQNDATDASLAVLVNERRQRTNAAGKIDVDVATQNPDGTALVLAETYTQVSAQDAQAAQSVASVATRTIVQGSLATEHKLAKFVATHVYDNLKHDFASGCSCPVSGTLTQQVTADDKSRSATHTYTFTGCGQATVTSNVTSANETLSGSSEVTWSNCN